MPIFEAPNGAGIHYQIKGEGYPLIFVHGWAMSGRIWDFQQELADSCRLVTLDLRGHGLSSAPEGRFSLADLAEDLAALINHLDLEQVTIAGWSLGAQVALKAYVGLRERLKALVLISGTPKFIATDGYPCGLPAQEVRGLGARLKRDHEKALEDFFQRMFSNNELPPEQVSRIGVELFRSSLPGQRVAQQGLVILEEEDLRQLLPEVNLPVFLLHGGSDTIIPLSATEFLAGQLPDARLKVLEGVGHAPFLTRPAEFNLIIRDFLREIYGWN